MQCLQFSPDPQTAHPASLECYTYLPLPVSISPYCPHFPELSILLSVPVKVYLITRTTERDVYCPENGLLA